MRFNKNIPLVLKVYLLAISVFFVFRVVLFCTELHRINFDEVAVWTIIQAFVMGLRFDIVISGYILLLPALVLLTQGITNTQNTVVSTILFYWIFIFFSIGFIISSADIPYFNQFFERFTMDAFQWVENWEFVLSMIAQEPSYFLASLPFILLEVIFFVLLKRIFHSKETKPVVINIYLNVFVSLLFVSLIFLGIRGRIEKKSPIRVGTAYFSNNAFLNKLGLNPVFTFMRSYLESKDSRNQPIDLMDKELAISKVREYLQIDSKEFISPIARNVVLDTVLEKKPNVVLILMESMSAAKMSRHGNPHNITPFLDSLSTNSLYFENFYTSGKHTHNGVFSSLFAFPALYGRHAMKQIRSYNGIGSTLQEIGYTTMYFTTHDEQFDNVGGFLKANGFEYIVSQKDYPRREVKTALGVPDDYMFRFSIPTINEVLKTDKPFFATFMTASDHGPYYIPEYFSPKSEGIKNKIVEYADWSLKKFIEQSSKQPWFDNTIFIFIADHGAPISSTYEVPLAYFHSPFVVYAPGRIESKKIYQDMGSQIDVYPTIMGLIQEPYTNNTLGIDLLKEKRTYAIINNNDKVGILDTAYFCIMGKEKTSLYRYKQGDKTDYYDKERQKAEEMSEYAKAFLQTYQEVLLNKQTSLQNNF